MVSYFQGRRPLAALSLVCALIAMAGVGLRGYLHNPTRGMPYRDSFWSGNTNEWRAFGGSWELQGGSIRNDSDERGAKLIVGSPYWRDYSIEADVMLLGSPGDAGLVIRSSDEEQGVDAYSGYYAGLRSVDNSLVLGQARHGWEENVLKLMPGSIQPAQWYHLKVLAFGCQIAVTATLPSTGNSATVSATDNDCITSGRAGLRSYVSGGAWRNVVVRPTTQQDLAKVLKEGKPSANSIVHAQFNTSPQGPAFSAPNPQGDQYTFHSSSHTQTIGSLRLDFFPKPATATIRGNVILTSPVLIVQDSTGGVSVPMPTLSPSLKVGDQVEVIGKVHTNDFSSILEQATVRVLWEGTPIPPVTVTASQAATGAFDATFIEVEGRLRGKQYGPGNTLIFDFDVGSQSFRTIMNRGRGDYLFGMLKPNSLLRLRGVCVVDPAYTQNLTPFVLLLRSADEVDVLAGPPWWSAGHLAAIAIGILLLALVVNFFYNRAERWRLRAVLEERERLAHEMHDTLAQSFAGIGFQLEAIRSGIPNDLPTTHQQLNLASDLVRHSHEEARRSIATLRPESHESGDLPIALYECARHMVEGGCVQILTTSSGDLVPIPLRITDTLYRIGQEAIANSVRHAHPATLTISLEYSKGLVCLVIADDGVGFVQTGDSRGFGVRGMRKRAASISATLQILSSPGQGTQIKIVAPLPPRITLLSWLQFLWKYIREQKRHVQPVG